MEKVKGQNAMRNKTNDLKVLFNGSYFIGRSMKRKCDHEENEIKDEKHKFSLCRRQFWLHLMLEQYILRKMNAGERCVLSEMMSTCDMTRREKQRFKSDRNLKKHCSFLIKTCVLHGQEAKHGPKL